MRNGSARTPVGGDLLEGERSFANVVVFGSAPVVRAPEDTQAVVPERQRTDEESIHNAKQRRGRADPETEREDGEDREARPAAHLAERMTGIGNQRITDTNAPRITRAFPLACLVPESATRLCLRGIGTPPVALEFLRFHLDVERELLVDL